MMRDEIRPPREIQASILDFTQYMIASPANVHDTICRDGTLCATAQRKMLVVTQLFQPQDERFPHFIAAGNGAIARLSGNNSARRAGVDELLWHLMARYLPILNGCHWICPIDQRQTNLDRLVTKSKAAEFLQTSAEVWSDQEHICSVQF